MSFELVAVNAGEDDSDDDSRCLEAIKRKLHPALAESSSLGETVSAGPDDDELVVEGPYRRTDPRFSKFVNEVLSEPADGGDDRVIKDNLLRVCGGSLLEYVRDKNYGLFNKVSQDKSMTPEKRQEFADNASEADGETDQYALVVSKTTKRKKIVGFLLAREISSTDVSEVRVYVDLVCRDKSDQRATGFSMFQRLREHYEKYARSSTRRLIFILDAVERAIAGYERWGFSRILNKKKKPSTNAYNGAFPMMMGLIPSANEDGKWGPEKRAEQSYVFVKTAEELKGSGDYENVRYAVTIE
ncbi:MAG: hypothetical protein CMI16_06840 [Opitutaceae bacterium]|nr:hypothetical protein [Opitutaceae bacterium]